MPAVRGVLELKLSCGQDHLEAEILRAAASISGKRQTPHAGPDVVGELGE